MTVPVEDGEAVGVAVGDGDEVDTRRMHSSVGSCVAYVHLLTLLILLVFLLTN